MKPASIDGREYSPIHHYVHDPTNSIFKQPANAKASSITVRCCESSCPLLAAGQCMMIGTLSTKCPYGKYDRSVGPTKRARSFYSWIRDKKALYDSVGTLKSPPEKMAFVGDYVYLPYRFMDMCEDAPFLRHAGILMAGDPLIHINNWSVDTVETLLDFAPKSMLGHQIHTYQKESVPKFLMHLREVDPEMWRLVANKRPHLDISISHVGRTALLKTLKSPIVIPAHDKRYPVSWGWDGERLTTSSIDAYNKTWGKIKPKSLVMSMTPEDDASIVVQDNDWVTDQTVFID